MLALPLAAALLTATSTCPGMAMVYYGGTQQDFDTIAASPPQIVIPGDIPTLAAQATLLHGAGITLLAYIDTGYAGTINGSGTTLTGVEASVDQAMQGGADGVLFDEATSDATPGTSEGTYYTALYQYVKGTYGAQKIVAINPGVGAPDISCFSVADIVCLECEWASFVASNYPGITPDRVMGLDSTTDCSNLSGGASQESQAVTDTAAAHALGVGYFYATSSYILLPSWYTQYVQTSGVCAAGGSTSSSSGAGSTGGTTSSSSGGSTSSGSSGGATTSSSVDSTSSGSTGGASSSSTAESDGSSSNGSSIGSSSSRSTGSSSSSTGASSGSSSGAGALDAGPADAGSTNAGGAGCGCSAGGDELPVLILLLAAAWSLRRVPSKGARG